MSIAYSELLAPDVMLEEKRSPDGKKRFVAIVAAGGLTPPEIDAAINRARVVLMGDPREVSEVQVCRDEEMLKARVRRRKAKRKHA